MRKLIIRNLIVGLLLFVSCSVIAQITVTSKNTKGILFLGEGEKQPLIVGLGGAEGGNYEHVPIEGEHVEPYKHFDLAIEFLERQFIK
jgi:hypothetical protein